MGRRRARFQALPMGGRIAIPRRRVQPLRESVGRFSCAFLIFTDTWINFQLGFWERNTYVSRVGPGKSEDSPYQHGLNAAGGLRE